MTRSGNLLSLLALATFAPEPFARQATEVARSSTQTLTAASVFERYFELTNARASFEDGQMLTLEGNVELEGMGLTGTFVQIQAFPPQSYMKMSIAGIGDVQTGYDGDVGWSVHPMMGAQLMEGSELFQLRFQGSKEALLRSPAVFEALEYEGTETFEERECHKVKLVAKPEEGMDAKATADIRTSYEYYEVDTGYLYATVQTAESPMGKVASTVLSMDYEEYDGVRMPTRIVQKTEMASLVMTVTAVEFQDVDAQAFTPPKAILTLKESRADAASQDR